jgi:hypothetical protein
MMSLRVLWDKDALRNLFKSCCQMRLLGKGGEESEARIWRGPRSAFRPSFANYLASNGFSYCL